MEEKKEMKNTYIVNKKTKSSNNVALILLVALIGGKQYKGNSSSYN